MENYQVLPHSGKNNVGTISKHLKQFSTYLKSSRSDNESDFRTKAEVMKNFIGGLTEEVFYSTVPSVQNAKLFALKNQYNIIFPNYEAIISLNETMFSQIRSGDDFTVVLGKLNEMYEELENIHKDICALYELFKEFELEEFQAEQGYGTLKIESPGKIEENKDSNNYDTLVLVSNTNEISQRLLDDNNSQADSSYKRKKINITSDSIKTWIWILIVLIITNILAFLILS